MAHDSTLLSVVRLFKVEKNQQKKKKFHNIYKEAVVITSRPVPVVQAILISGFLVGFFFKIWLEKIKNIKKCK